MTSELPLIVKNKCVRQDYNVILITTELAQ